MGYPVSPASRMRFWRASQRLAPCPDCHAANVCPVFVVSHASLECDTRPIGHPEEGEASCVGLAEFSVGFSLPCWQFVGPRGGDWQAFKGGHSARVGGLSSFAASRESHRSATDDWTRPITNRVMDFAAALLTRLFLARHGGLSGHQLSASQRPMVVDCLDE